MHQRTIIRKQVVATLKGVTKSKNRIYPSRVRPLWENELPAICVYTLEDDPAIEVEAPLSYVHALDLVLDVSVEQAENADDLLDEICKEIEVALSQDDTLDKTCMQCRPGKTEITTSNEGERPTFVAKVHMNVQYRSYWPQEIIGQNAPVDLAGIDTQIKGNGTTEIDSTVNLGG